MTTQAKFIETKSRTLQIRQNATPLKPHLTLASEEIGQPRGVRRQRAITATTRSSSTIGLDRSVGLDTVPTPRSKRYLGYLEMRRRQCKLFLD